jgi:hypothetical protein
MSLERFAEIVEAAKQQELEVDQLQAKIDGLTYALAKKAEKVKILKEKDTDKVKLHEGRIGRDWHTETQNKHDDETNGIIGVSKQKNTGRFCANINYINPETGRKTSTVRGRDTLVEAIIARNEIAATLLREGLIDFERFKKFTSL